MMTLRTVFSSIVFPGISEFPQGEKRNRENNREKGK